MLTIKRIEYARMIMIFKINTRPPRPAPIKVINNRKIVSDKSGDLIFRYADLKKQLSLIESEIEQIKENIILTIKQIGNKIEFDDFICGISMLFVNSLLNTFPY